MPRDRADRRLGRAHPTKDAKNLRPLIANQGVPGATVDHGSLVGLGDDDHSQYVHISAARTISAQHNFTNAGSPFTVTSTTKVTNLNADLLDGFSTSQAADATAHVVVTNSSGHILATKLQAPLIDTASGDLTLDPASGTVVVDSILRATEVETASGDLTLDPNSGTVVIDNTLSLVEIITASGSLTLDPADDTVVIETTLDVDTVTSSTNLTISPTGDVIFDPTGNDLLPNTGYDLNIGAINKKYLTLHAAELWVETLVAQNTIATIGGRILVGPTTILEADLAGDTPGPADTQMTVKHNQMVRQDTAYMEANGQVEFINIGALAITAVNTTSETFTIAGDWTSTFTNGVKFTVVESTGNDGEWTVSSSSYSIATVITVTGDITDATVDGYILYTGQQGTGPYTYLSVTRHYEDVGAGTAHDWYAGDAVFNTGQTGDGFMDLYSVQGIDDSSSAGPTIVGNVRTATDYKSWTEHWAIGNLNGLYGVSSDTYGVGLGKYGDDHVLIDASNGIQFRDASDNVVAQLNSANWTLGRVDTGYENVYITASGIQLRTNTTVYAELSGDTLTLGDDATGDYLTLSSGGIEFYSNNDLLLDLDSAGNLTLGEVTTDQGNVYWNTSNKRLEFRGGTGGTDVQAYIDTDGTITAGAGGIKLTDDGLIMNEGTNYYLRWEDSGTIRAQIRMYDYAVAGTSYLTFSNSGSQSDKRFVFTGGTLDADGLFADWIEVGSTSITTSTGDVGYTGDLSPYRNSTTYTGYVMWPYAAADTGDYEGITVSSSTTITLNTGEGYSVPADAKAVMVRLTSKDSTAGTVIALGPTSSSPYTIGHYHNVADAYESSWGIVKTTVNGSNIEIYLFVSAAVDTVYVHIWGYFV